MKNHDLVNDLLLWKDSQSFKLLQDTAEEYRISVDAIAELTAWQRERQQIRRSRNRNEVFDSVFDNESLWTKE